MFIYLHTHTWLYVLIKKYSSLNNSCFYFATNVKCLCYYLNSCFLKSFYFTSTFLWCSYKVFGVTGNCHARSWIFSFWKHSAVSCQFLLIISIYCLLNISVFSACSSNFWERLVCNSSKFFNSCCWLVSIL